MKYLNKFNENSGSKESWNREEHIKDIRAIAKDIFESFNDEELNEIKMRNEYGRERGKAFDIYIDRWISKNGI